MQQEATSQAGERTQHTPGPWSMPETKKGMLPIHVANNNDKRTKNGFCHVAAVGDLMEGPMDYAEVVANARLISSAPELLSTLIIARDYAADISLISNDGVLDRPAIARLIDAVIKKATQL